ncbi:MAG: hypothetical protein FJZ90_07555 [Chloroflexi bacterium]|nr:hypothetical protein [Chloroflexota bacterium]
MDFSRYRLVDLTHVIEPDTGPRPVHIERVAAIHAVPEGQWYIMHRVQMYLNHVGTHIETPYHVRPDGNDVATVPLESTCGPGVVLDLTAVPPGAVVSEAQMRAAADKAGGVQRGDIVFLRFDDMGDPETVRHFEAEAIGFLVDAGARMVGTDLAGVELPASDPRLAEQYNHHQLLDHDICLIEHVGHLNRLTRSRFMVFALTIPIVGLDSFPIRILALEER